MKSHVGRRRKFSSRVPRRSSTIHRNLHSNLETREHGNRRRSLRLMKTLPNSPAETNANSAITSGKAYLRKIELIPGDGGKYVESLFEDVFENASLLQVEVEQCVSLQDLRVRPLHTFGIKRAIHLLKGESIGSVTGRVSVGNFPVIVELPYEYRS